MFVALLGLLLGLGLVLWWKGALPLALAPYTAVAILAGLDALCGGLKATLEKKFDSFIFVTGAWGNMLIAALLVYVGDRLGMAHLELAAEVAFGVRIFQNLAIARRYALERWRGRGGGRPTPTAQEELAAPSLIARLLPGSAEPTPEAGPPNHPDVEGKTPPWPSTTGEVR